MGSVAKSARVEIRIDELLVADGQINNSSVEVRVAPRDSAALSPFSGAVSELLPQHLGVRLNEESLKGLTPLELPDGRGALIPSRWKSLHFGKGPSLAELCRRNYEGAWHPYDGAEDPILGAVERARQLAQDAQPDFDDHPANLQAQYLLRTLRKMVAIEKAYAVLEQHLTYGRPGRGNAAKPTKTHERDVHAALLADVLGRTRSEVGKAQGQKPPPPDRYYNSTVEQSISRGRDLLTRAFSEGEGWPAVRDRLRAMRGWRQRCKALLDVGHDEEQEFYGLLAEARATTRGKEHTLALSDGFQHTLENWLKAWASDDPDDWRTAVAIQCEDDRPGQVLHILGLLEED